jgi:large subunit ribosomal protein L17
MRHQVRGRKLNRTASHRKALMMNLACSLVIHKKINTTDAKAKELRGYVERLVTYAKKDDVHGRRLIQKKLHGKLGKRVANILIHEIAPAYAERSGGYTRIIKLNNRKNDNAPVSLIEFVDLSPVVETETVVETDEKSK